MEKRVYNFSPGPAVLPLPVLQEAQRDLVPARGGRSILEISHRSKTFDRIINQAEANLRTLLGIPDNYRVLFLQGGAILQFGMVAMNLLRDSGKPANYLVHGTWSQKASEEAKTQGPVNVAWTGKASNFNRVPRQGEPKLDPHGVYVYMCSNETIQGVQYPTEPDTGSLPLICDSSSDFLCRPVDVKKYGLIFACAEERRPGRGDDRHHPRRPGGAVAGQPAVAGELQGAGRGQVAAEYPADLRHLYRQARDRLAGQGNRRAREDDTRSIGARPRFSTT